MIPLDRRELLKLLAALPASAAFPMLSACSRSEAVPAGAPFSVWHRVREALRTSPDHLEARAHSVVASGDLPTIFEFVRDEIALRPWVMPTHAVQVQAAGYAGRRGVLRSGYATAREKAELLSALLTEAGFDAEIVDGDVDFEALGGTARFTGTSAPRFAPDAALAPLDSWLEKLGIEAAAYLREATLDPAVMEATAQRLLAAIAPDARGPQLDWAKLNDWIALVRVTQNGESLYANPNLPDAVLGEHYCLREPRPSPVQGPVATPTLKLSLAMTRRSAPGVPESILEGEWPIGELVGRRLQLRFLPTQPVDTMLSMSLGQLRSFQPAFVVAGDDVSEAEAGRLGFSGDVITLEGERISVSGDSIVIDGEPVMLGDADPTLAATVQQVELAVNASEYPRVHVEAGLRRGDGTAVNGLPLSVFALHNDERPVAARMLRNMPEPPRIAFVLDFSTSLAEAYRGVRLAPVVGRMCRAVADRIPGARFRVGAFSGGTTGNAVRYLSGWSEDAGAAVESIRRQGPTAPQVSSYFSSLADATNSDANLVVLITDADGGDSERPDSAAQISKGCPAIVLGVPGPLTHDEHFKRLAQLSGGHLYLVDALDDAVLAVVELADGAIQRPYRFEFVADGGEDGDARLQFAVPASGAGAVAAYRCPAEPVSPVRAICGLFLTAELGSRRVTRRLAGFPLVSTALKPLTDEDIDATRLAFFGRYDLSVEAAAPTAAAALEEIVSANLSCEAIVAAAASRDEDTILAATQAGFEQLPAGWLALNTPLPDARAADRLSFQAGYRLILFCNMPEVAGHFRRKVDILPFSDWHTIAPGDAFAQNLRHTLQLSLLEAESFADSTLARVGDSGYELKPSHQLTNWAAALDDAALNQQWRIAAADRAMPRLQQKLLLPANPSRLAYWEIDTVTGAVLGILPDASGGASVADTNRKFELLTQVIEAYTQIMEALIATPPAFKVWMELEKAKLEHLKRATIAVILMDGTHTSGYGDLLADQLEGWITDKVQSAVDKGLGEAITGYSELQDAIGWHDKAQQMWNAIGADA